MYFLSYLFIFSHKVNYVIHKQITYIIRKYFQACEKPMIFVIKLLGEGIAMS